MGQLGRFHQVPSVTWIVIKVHCKARRKVIPDLLSQLGKFFVLFAPIPHLPITPLGC
jgi:hypothetical protein